MPANNKDIAMKIKLSQSQWKEIGTKMGWIKTAQEEDIEQIASGLKFLPTRKKLLVYKHWDGDTESMPPMSYKVMNEAGISVTKLDNSERPHKPGDIMMCGPKGEKYSMDPSQFAKKYEGKIGGDISVEQTPRMVARYDGPRSIRFIASFGQGMDLKPGDYLVMEGPGKYYRIEKGVFKETYNEPGS